MIFNRIAKADDMCVQMSRATNVTEVLHLVQSSGMIAMSRTKTATVDQEIEARHQMAVLILGALSA